MDVRVPFVECCTFDLGNFRLAVSVRQGVLHWDNVARGLADRVESCAAERRARAQAAKYEAWASRVIDECLDDLTREVTERLAHFDPETRKAITLETVYPSHILNNEQGRVQRVLCLQLELDQVHIHGQRQPGNAPTVHLLWSRRRQNRYCQTVPIVGGRLMPLHHTATDQAGDPSNSLVGYRILAGESSSDELSRERLLFRTFGLLASGASS